MDKKGVAMMYVHALIRAGKEVLQTDQRSSNGNLEHDDVGRMLLRRLDQTYELVHKRYWYRTEQCVPLKFRTQTKRVAAEYDRAFKRSVKLVRSAVSRGHDDKGKRFVQAVRKHYQARLISVGIIADSVNWYCERRDHEGLERFAPFGPPHYSSPFGSHCSSGTKNDRRRNAWSEDLNLPATAV